MKLNYVSQPICPIPYYGDDFTRDDATDTFDDILDSMELDSNQLSSIKERFNSNQEFFVQPRHIKILASSRKYLTEEEE